MIGDIIFYFKYYTKRCFCSHDYKKDNKAEYMFGFDINKCVKCNKYKSELI